MQRFVLALVIMGLAATGCLSYTGGARPAQLATLAQDPAWMLAPVPTVRQQNRNDCGIAALDMVLQRWGQHVPRATVLAEVGPLTEHGVALGALRDVALQHGLAAFVVVANRSDLEYELTAGRPVLVGLLRPHGSARQSHFEVVVGLQRTSGAIATVDPGSGPQVRTWHDFADEWDAAGRPALVVLGPP
ncbi:MAG TPA: cysteine peptidase family C39 domain-containing protein [Kofleriaceae bacterium]|nr:cysteine peptidase family C39 domain-containing protein [Kofleriaceae bacterium]